MKAVTPEAATLQMSDAELLAILRGESAEPAQPRLRLSLNPTAHRKAISFVAGLVPNKTRLPILGTIHCSGNGSTRFRSTDLDLTIEADLPVLASAPGECVLPKAALVSAFKTSKQGIAIELGDNLVADITADGCKRSVPTLSPEEFPQPVTFNAEFSTQARATAFKEALRQVALAMSEDVSRYVLNGVLMECTPTQIHLCATDGRRIHHLAIQRLGEDKEWMARIAEAKCALDSAEQELKSGATKAKEKAIEKARFDYDSALAFRVIIPTGTVNQLLKLPLDSTLDVVIIKANRFVASDDNSRCHVSFAYDVFTLTSKQVDGIYPNWRQVIPKDHKEKVTLVAEEFSRAIAQAKTCTTEKCNSVKLRLLRHKLLVSGESPEKGNTTAEVAVNYIGQEITTAFDPEYLLDVCAAFKGKEMVLHLTDELTPGTFTCDGATAVVMPMRLA